MMQPDNVKKARNLRRAPSSLLLADDAAYQVNFSVYLPTPPA
jgi:hypothetical protein